MLPLKCAVFQRQSDLANTNGFSELERGLKEALIKEPPGNAQLFRLARRDLFSSRSGLFRPRLFQKK
jgi:hypothetical protein